MSNYRLKWQYLSLPLLLCQLVLGENGTQWHPDIVLKSPILATLNPFDEVWMMGQVEDRILLITNSHSFYSVKLAFLTPTGLSLTNATVVPFPEKLPVNIGGNGNHLTSILRHAVLLHRAQQTLLYFDVGDEDVQGKPEPRLSTHQGVVINLNTNLPYRSAMAPRSFLETWLSCPNESAFFMLRRGAFDDISLAMCRIRWSPNSPPDQPDLSEVRNLTAFYRICLFVPGKHDWAIYLTPLLCPYPVHWDVLSGFVSSHYVYLFSIDRVYVFSKRLFLNPGIKGNYYESDFENFFWKSGTDNSLAGQTTAVIVFLILCILIFVITLLGMIYCYFEPNRESTHKEESHEKEKPPSEIRWTKKYSPKKRNEEQAASKLGSKMLPSANEVRNVGFQRESVIPNHTM